MNFDQDAGQLIGPILTIAFLGWLFWAMFRRKHPKVRQVSDEPEGAPYRVYTKKFDRVAIARDAPAMMREANRGIPAGGPPNLPTWPARMAAVERLAESYRSTIAEAETKLVPALADAANDLAVMLLIDQSGSMRNNILSVAAVIRWISPLFDRYEVPLSIAGFTTLGWRGGEARRQWIRDGQPKRPGRLCALLHIRYRDFEQPMMEEDWRVMAHPGMLCENIDGEAIQWAVGQLSARRERRKLLVVLSDGAPVDDSTLSENAPSLLERHIMSVIEETESAGVVQIGAVGIEYEVGRYYSRSTSAIALSELPSALGEQIANLART